MKRSGGSHDKINSNCWQSFDHKIAGPGVWESSSGLDMGRQIGLKSGIRFGFTDAWTEATADARPEAFPKLEKGNKNNKNDAMR